MLKSKLQISSDTKKVVAWKLVLIAASDRCFIIFKKDYCIAGAALVHGYRWFLVFL